MLATDRNTRRMNLSEARVGEQCTAPMRPPDGSAVARLGVGRQIEDVGIPARRQHNHVGGVTRDLPGYEVPRHDATSSTVDDHHVEQLAADVHRHAAIRQLLFQGLIGAKQQLLSGLTARVKGSLDLHAAERARVEQSSVLARERHSLCNALVDYVEADLGEAVNIRLARAKVSALNRVVEEPEDAVAVVAV